MTDPSKAVIETAHRGLLMASVVLASLIYAIDWTIAAVVLPHMQARSRPPRTRYRGCSPSTSPPAPS